MTTTAELISGLRIRDAEARGKIRALLRTALANREATARWVKGRPIPEDLAESLIRKNGVGWRRALARAAGIMQRTVPEAIVWPPVIASREFAAVNGAFLYARDNPIVIGAEAEPLLLAVNYLRLDCDRTESQVFLGDGLGAMTVSVHALERLTTRRRDLSLDAIRRGILEATIDARLIMRAAPGGKLDYAEVDVPAFGGCFRGFVRYGQDTSAGMQTIAHVDVRTFYDAGMLDPDEWARVDMAAAVLADVRRHSPVELTAQPLWDGKDCALLSDDVAALMRPATRSDWLMMLEETRTASGGAGLTCQ